MKAAITFANIQEMLDFFARMAEDRHELYDTRSKMYNLEDQVSQLKATIAQMEREAQALTDRLNEARKADPWHNLCQGPSDCSARLVEVEKALQNIKNGGLNDGSLLEFKLREADPALNKINVIRVIREYTGLGLKEAKDLVEKFYPSRFDKTP